MPEHASELYSKNVAALLELMLDDNGALAPDFSDEILRHCPAVTLLWSIDRWSDHHDAGEYWRVAERLEDMAVQGHQRQAVRPLEPEGV